MIIVSQNDQELSYTTTGYNLYIDGRKKYFGRFHEALKRFGWIEAALFLSDEVEPLLKQKTSELFPKKVRVKWSFDGVAGPYEAETYPHHRGAILNLTAFTDSHLAKSPTTSSTVFPSTHAQSGLGMIIMDVQSKTFRDDPFSSEEDLLNFMKERLGLIQKAMEGFTEIKGKNESAEDDEDDSDNEEAA